MIEYAKNGAVHTFELDVEKICEMEEKDPNFDFLAMVSELGEKMRLSSLAKLCTFVGSSYKQMTQEYHLTVSDIGNILTKCMEDAGFLSES